MPLDNRLELDTEGIMSGVRVGLSLENQTDDNNLVLIKPRIPRGARLNLRLLTHDDDDSEANAGSSRMAIDTSAGVMPPARTPVCAYLLPDHIEWAMEVFDHEGYALGQLKVADRNWAHSGIQKGKLAWDPSPGRETPVGALPEISNPHASNLINSLIEIGLVDDLERGKWDDNNAAGIAGGEMYCLQFYELLIPLHGIRIIRYRRNGPSCILHGPACSSRQS